MQNTKPSFNNIQKRSEKDSQNRRNANFVQWKSNKKWKDRARWFEKEQDEKQMTKNE